MHINLTEIEADGQVIKIQVIEGNDRYDATLTRTKIWSDVWISENGIRWVIGDDTIEKWRKAAGLRGLVV